MTKVIWVGGKSRGPAGRRLPVSGKGRPRSACVRNTHITLHHHSDLMWCRRQWWCRTRSGIIAAAAAAPIVALLDFPLLYTYIISLCPQLSGHFNHMMSVSHQNWCSFPDAENLISHLCDAILCGYAIDIHGFSSIFCNRSIITRPTTSTVMLVVGW